MYDFKLIIRARREEQVYELLLVHTLDGNFSKAFVHNYAH